MTLRWFTVVGAALAVFFSASVAANAQASDPKAAEASALSVSEADEPATPAMWKLSDKDSEIWLLGTFHILPPDLDWRSKAVAAAIDKADTFWFEAEVDTAEANQKTVQILMTEGFNKPGETLSGLLGPEDAERLAAVARDVGLQLAAIDSMRPWQAFLALSVRFVVSRGFDPASGVETVLLKEARARKAHLRFFETVEQQLGLFTSLPPQTEKRLLVATLRDWDKQAGEFDALFDAWRSGDVATLDGMMNDEMREEAPKAFETLVTKRNEAWADEIAKAMAGSGKTLVAVGAGHLVGAHSVPALLKAKGFKVERCGPESCD